ncbi:metallophosphoesterase [Bacteroides sp. K03]|uniref:metallophosphoesterase n=1 Tax=Bacteroides TaxID=816 RepID=UPI001C8C8250|nr:MULTISPECIES: metallophosphoesterase [Bacteroides]MBX9187981.1 metallophosphoesterase [Bacteroides sp. K03]
MKKLIYFLFLLSFLFSSCKSKKNLVVSPSYPILNVDSLHSDTSTLSSTLFAPDYSTLKKPERNKKHQKQSKSVVARPSVPAGTAPGTLITHSAVSTSSAYKGVDRVVKYDFTHRDVPEAFDGFRIAFISDLHYKSLFKEKELAGLVRLLIAERTDVLLMGGDYQEGCEYVPELFAALSQVKTPMGTYGVMGNNDYERCHDDIVREMQRYGMRVLEHRVDTLKREGQQILIAGVRNPFDLKQNAKSPTLDLSPEDFVILLVHTPDYVEDVSVANTDLALAGHTHGGQVRIFGYAPIIPSHYGSRFLTGLKYNTANIPMIVTNGLGTSNRNIRIGAPTEVVVITLHQQKQ